MSLAVSVRSDSARKRKAIGAKEFQFLRADGVVGLIMRYCAP
jgi:hypothetical protein